ncbi:SRPBCC domain-containing protein [Azospirillum sp. ST 5-10]|uniref:SRPBCC domain-containing protein n=1 Tax=unclassified Azospirillum TaxID=2630922 RepID=UPI003F49C1CE
MSPQDRSPRRGDPTVSIALVRRLDASVALAFEACTDPKWLARWLTPGAGAVRSATVDIRPGGAYRLDGIDPDGTPYEISGRYLDIAHAKRIVATWNYDGAVADLGGPTSKVRIDLRPLGEDACELTLTHTELTSTEAAELYRTVWSICLDRLAWAADPDPADPAFRVPFGAMADIYGERHRALQDRFDTRRLANRLRKVAVASTLGDDHRTFIEACDMAFLTTVDHRGFPTCSYKGGAPGFVRVADDRTLLLPSYDGNGMYLSAGNVSANPKVGLLFIDFETPHRLRIHGTATLVRDDAALQPFPGAELLVVVKVMEAFINCPRYVHRYRRIATSRFVPAAGWPPEMAPWKNLDFVRDAIPDRDRARLDASGAQPMTREEYLERLKNGDV